MLKSCPACGRIHDVKMVCRARRQRQEQWLKDHDRYNTEARSFRRKQRWKDMSMHIRDRDNHLCQLCIRDMYSTGVSLNHRDVSVHHILPVSRCPDRALDPTNLITLCAAHHTAADAGCVPAEILESIAREQEEKFEQALS